MQCLQRYAGLLRNAVLKSIQPFTLRTPNVCQMCQTQLNQYQTSKITIPISIILFFDLSFKKSYHTFT